MNDAERKALLALSPVPPERQERYGPHPSQVIDLYGTDAAGPRIVVLHGGFWREQWDRTHLTPFAAALAGRGFPVALVEYRRVGGDGGWPATAEDVAAALRHLGGPAGALVGHSAGGQLALWAAAQGEHTAARAVVVAPVADLARAHELRLSDGAVAAFLGGG
ncbi:alpha/beta hydrolase, partial [Streptomyces boncukensis]